MTSAASAPKRTRGAPIACGGRRRFGTDRVSSYRRASEVVADPDREARLAELVAAAGGREQEILPVAAEQRPPRPVEVNREAEREGFEAEAVRGAAVDEAE